jgi:exo-beta-1,3-glucanase (GH17 family)
MRGATLLSLALLAGVGTAQTTVADVLALTKVGPGDDGAFCMDFSPYVAAPGGQIYTPGGFEPPIETVEALLENLVNTGRVKCILLYGSQGAAGYVPGIIRRRGWASRLKVIQGAWLDGPPTTAEANQAQIDGAIALSKAYEDVIVAMMCGSEVRLRFHRGVALQVVMPCLAQARAAGVRQVSLQLKDVCSAVVWSVLYRLFLVPCVFLAFLQPLTHQATWVRFFLSAALRLTRPFAVSFLALMQPEWCDEEFPGEKFPTCARWEPMASAVDFISQTTYAFWENRVHVRFPCIPPQDAAEFHLNRQMTLVNTYAGYKPVIMSEVGHPGPRTLFVDNEGGAPCSTASKEIQMQVGAETMARCRELGQSCILFNAVSKNRGHLTSCCNAFSRLHLL